MKALDLFKLSTRMFRTRPSRTLLTILGVSVGIGTILFLVSFGYGLQKMLLERITTDEALLSLDVIPPVSKIVKLDAQTMKTIKEIPDVEKVSPVATFAGQITLGELNSDVLVQAIKVDYLKLAGVSPRWGKLFEEKDAYEIIVSQALAKSFNLNPEAILGEAVNFTFFIPKETDGVQEIEVSRRENSYKVIGVAEEEILPYVYLSLASIQDIAISEYSQAKVKVKNDKVLEAVREEIMNKGFLVSSVSETIDQANKIFGIFQAILAVFGVIALIVAAIGLINTMTISLLERINEVGIMRAIGASSPDIMRIFLSESLLIGFFGGLGGILIGILGAEFFNWSVNIFARTLGGQTVDLFVYPWWFLAFIIGLSSFVGFIAGIWPARRAASLNPLQALRYK